MLDQVPLVSQRPGCWCWCSSESGRRFRALALEVLLLLSIHPICFPVEDVREAPAEEIKIWVRVQPSDRPPKRLQMGRAAAMDHFAYQRRRGRVRVTQVTALHMPRLYRLITRLGSSPWEGDARQWRVMPEGRSGEGFTRLPVPKTTNPGELYSTSRGSNLVTTANGVLSRSGKSTVQTGQSQANPDQTNSFVRGRTKSKKRQKKDSSLATMSMPTANRKPQPRAPSLL